MSGIGLRPPLKIMLVAVVIPTASIGAALVNFEARDGIYVFQTE